MFWTVKLVVRKATHDANPILEAMMRPIRRWFGRPYVRRADTHRSRSAWIDAVIDYRRGLDWMPWRDDLKIQIGNCLKEFGEYRGAIEAYRSVASSGDRSEALKQMADARRRAGIDILPYAIGENAAAVGQSNASSPPLSLITNRMLPNRMIVDAEQPRRWLGTLGQAGNRTARGKGVKHLAIILDQVGSLSMERDGAYEPVFAGVIAIRARIVGLPGLHEAEICLGEGEAAQRIAVVKTHLVESRLGTSLHVINAWIDTGRLRPGRHWLSVRAGRGVPPAGLFINIVDPSALDLDVPASNSFCPSPSSNDLDVDCAIIQAPAEIRSAARSPFRRPVRTILAMRVDQLGDVSASLPAMARLRELFPDAKITLLVQSSVRAAVESSMLADEVLTLDLSYDPVSENRYLSADEEARVRRNFSEEKFDLAIDLCPGDETRPLLLLTGAEYLTGFNADRFPFLDYGISVRSRDKINKLDNLSHAASVLTLIEALAVAVAEERPAVARLARSEHVLAKYGLNPGSYVVLHMGARHALNRWPADHFLELAERLLDHTALGIVLFPDGADLDHRPAIAGNDRLRALQMIDGDEFDAIIANARLLIGNDSGPKHLAAARGVATISIHVDRLNWDEWGQDSRGTIISKRMPCTGCGLNDIRMCGREAICVRSISVDEVWQAAQAYL
jgi:ADP-heptose:LPS heptosyltransferase